ncbi:MAG: type II toxin-antitoxin system prevent-host-death family antitoxin [Gammaproteobacteria bacterium]|nr:type II toxin-antitoxin system prevent-host-death family antitoxin [Rhodocyclaceae bacterium]MBU3910133.1 type II toxin-antitoxin system prevent-host-death family antitoxin [Gammaproteobacteria bacterium]MBU3990056.1 type II toxin-antitoxin system prevent-host-death family antitoxin [Gammaproteobacteria bacterium]MBU4006140.1 type II toxin-antitoxin system prevent-host-death family antitoxin [Gammaproteobacteria bacterium]MBU4022595.1 type II toxin-antitoxin system prevent-host-death family 
MHKSQWRLQDAKAQFSQVVEAALQGEPQHVTRRGRDAVVVLSEASYRVLQQSSRIAAPGFVAHLLAVPKRADVNFARGGIELRDVEL